MSLGNPVLQSLRESCATASSATWLGQSPSGDLVFVARASCVTHADLGAMERACRAVAGVRSVRYEIDCGDRAVRLMVGTGCASPAPRAGRLAPAWLLLEVGALAWSCRVLGWV